VSDHGVVHKPRALLTTVVATAALGLSACGSHDSAPPAALTAGIGTTLDRPLPHSVTSLRFKDPQGRVVTLGSYAGKTLVLSDSMTLCSEDCPLDTANVVSAARATDSAGLTDKVEFLSITVDPERDTPHQLAAYRKLYAQANAIPNWQLLTGSKAAIAALWHYLGVWYKRVPEGTPPDHDWLTGKPLTYDVAHSDQVFLFDDQQHERMEMSGHAHVPSPSTVPPRLRAYLSKLGHRHLDHPGADTWTAQDVIDGVQWLTGSHISSS
jgi:protein SCO1